MSSFFKGSSSRALQSQLEGLSWSRELTESPNSFRISPLDTVGYDGELACIAHDPIQSLLAVATKSGRITIYAKPGLARVSWQLRPQQAIKYLLFKSGTPFLIVIDAKETLHIFDYSELDDRDEPTRVFATSLRAAVTCVEYIPSLSHILLGCQDGTVDTFDVDRLCSSPYRIKNLWIEQDELLRRSGVMNAPSKRRIPACTDLKTHPLDPNQLLLAYEGGVVLYNLQEQQQVCIFEYLILPGAPGGHNDQSEGAFLERRPLCICLAWRPDGRMFAAGYDDGSIAFWSIEDGDKPVLARTVAMEDVNLATASNMFGDDGVQTNESLSMREPIFKLAWSHFTTAYGASRSAPDEKPPSGTILTILGGLLPDEPKGLRTLHFPAYVAPGTLMGATPAQTRDALRKSVTLTHQDIVPTESAPEDFVLLTESPYYGQAQDPYAVLCLLSPDPDLPKLPPHTERGFVAYPFPPQLGQAAKEYTLPMEMYFTGPQAVVKADAVSLPGITHKRLSPEEPPASLPLSGGMATSRSQLAGDQRRGPKSHPALLSVHVDMSVRIWDTSSPIATLIESFSPREALNDAQLMAYLEGKVLIEQSSASWEQTELALALSTGEVMVYRFGYAKASAVLMQQEQDRAAHYKTSPAHATVGTSEDDFAKLDLEMAAAASTMNIAEEQEKQRAGLFSRRKTAKGKGRGGPSGTSENASSGGVSSFELDFADTSGLSDWRTNGYKPVFTLSPLLPSRTRRVSALSLSEGGFLAVAWEEMLAIVDLRGPEVLHSEGSERAESGGIRCLTWTVCALGEDAEVQPRLIASYASGLQRIFTLSYTLDTWIVNSHTHTMQHGSLASPLFASVFDRHGIPQDLTGSSLDECLRRQSHAPSSNHHHAKDGHGLNSLLAVVSESCISVYANITGERLVKKEFGQVKAVSAQLVNRYGLPVLVVVMQDGQCVVWSLPQCDPVRTLQVQFERSRSSISSAGQIVQTLSPSLVHLSTFFPDMQAPPPAKPKYYDASRMLPPQPPASAIGAAAASAATAISSWFGSATGKSVAQPATLDDVFGGPNRPPPKIKPVKTTAPEQGAVAGSSSAASSSRAAPAPPPRGSKSAARQIAAQHLPEETTYDRWGRPVKTQRKTALPGRELTDALEERGERLDFLSENLEKANKASGDFVNQARRMAMMQGAKGTFQAGATGAVKSFNKMFD